MWSILHSGQNCSDGDVVMCQRAIIENSGRAVSAVARLVCEELRFPSSGAPFFPKSRKSPFRGPFISDVPGLIG